MAVMAGVDGVKVRLQMRVIEHHQVSSRSGNLTVGSDIFGRLPMLFVD